MEAIWKKCSQNFQHNGAEVFHIVISGVLSYVDRHTFMNEMVQY